ncbi:hypothetical protein OpiT1DRAFT_02755 [Opitutaceae bacterium TAV1]|nr:hypothetical protein OpiT1DRAFT_02755 [Opitutaceae bacterium TAV1]
MQDPFTGRNTRLRGAALPGAAGCAALQDDHERRLEALARLRAAAAAVGIATDPDDDLVLFPEDELSLLRGADPLWAEMAAAVDAFRALLPVVPLEVFGFPEGTDDPVGDGSPRLRRIGSGVEASAFEAEDGSIYKFFLPREEGRVGGSFVFGRGDEQAQEPALLAEACLGSYGDLFEKLRLILALDGMPTEVVGVTPEGVVITKQALGDRLPEGTDTSAMLPAALLPIPARFLRAHRDHPRLFFHGGRAWLVADLHAKNLVRAADGAWRVIDLLAAPWPMELAAREPLMADWLARVQLDPAAGLLRGADDAEL